MATFKEIKASIETAFNKALETDCVESLEINGHFATFQHNPIRGVTFVMYYEKDNTVQFWDIKSILITEMHKLFFYNENGAVIGNVNVGDPKE